MTRIFMDWEFAARGNTIIPMSVGLIAENKEEVVTYYAINSSADFVECQLINPWLTNNVMNHYPGTMTTTGFYPDLTHSCYRSQEQMAWDIEKFITKFESPELWAWYGAYDHVCLGVIYGEMIKFPAGVPMWTNDIKTIETMVKHKYPNQFEFIKANEPKQGSMTEHHAMYDAMHDQDLFRYYADYLILSSQFNVSNPL